MFTVLNLQINRGSTSSNAQGGSSVTITHTYKDLTLTVASIKLLFPDYLNQGPLQDSIFVGDHMFVEGSDTTIYCKILSLAPFTLGPDLFSGASGLSIGPTVVATDNNAAVITGDTLQMERADKTHSGIVTETIQDIGGEKTFWANTTIIPQNDFVVMGEGTGPLALLIKTEATVDGVQVLGHNTNQNLAYVFGTQTLGPAYAGMAFNEVVDGGDPLLVLTNNTSAALAIRNDLRVAILSNTLEVDKISEFNPGAGVTLINNTAVIPTADFAVANENLYASQFKIKAQTAPSGAMGASVLTNDVNMALAYSFGTANLGAYYAGMLFSENLFFGAPTLVLMNNGVLALAIDGTGKVLVDVINEFHVGVGTTINGANLIGGGIQFNPAETLLDKYSEAIYTTTFTNGALTSAAVSFKIIRVGKTVTINTQTTGGSTVGQVAPGVGFVADTPLPADFQSSNPINDFWRVLNGGVVSIGLAEVSGGTFTIFNNPDQTTAFTAAVTNEFSFGTITYNID